MEKKRFQVFISSTFVDLEKERAAVFDSLTKIDCIPAGMEIFPAFDDEQFTYIKAIIDDSDYYVLIIGARYGSLSAEGISFTESEYDYAVSKSIPVLSFIHGDPDSIPAKYTDKDPKKEEMLKAFVEKVRKGRLVQDWKNENELCLKVTQAVMHSIKAKPGVGWIRGSAAASVEILTEINELRKQNAAQTAELQMLKEKVNPKVENIAPLDQEIKVRFISTYLTGVDRQFEIPFSWKKLFALIGPSLISEQSKDIIGSALARYVQESNISHDFGRLRVVREDLDTIKLQLVAYEFLELLPARLQTGVEVERLKLTPRGMQELVELKAVRAREE